MSPHDDGEAVGTYGGSEEAQLLLLLAAPVRNFRQPLLPPPPLQCTRIVGLALPAAHISLLGSWHSSRIAVIALYTRISPQKLVSAAVRVHTRTNMNRRCFLAAFCLLALSSPALCDIYMHNPRGSNNRRLPPPPLPRMCLLTPTTCSG